MATKKPYGDVKYADPGYQDDKKKRYPLDTAAHVKAAASYFGMEKNRSKYTAEQQKKIDAAIKAAEKKLGIGEHSVPVKEHEIFEAGTHVTKSGETVTYTEKDLDEMCVTFDQNEPPHYIPGHSSDWPGVTMIPSLGQIKGSLKRIGSKLYAVGAEFTDRLAGWVREGFYDQRSCEVARVDGKLKLIAVAMLGAQPPAVRGMPPINADMLQSEYMFSKRNETLEFAESVAAGIDWEEVEDKAIEKILEDCQKEFDELMSTLTEELVQTKEDNDDDEEELAEKRSNCFNVLFACYDTVTNKLRAHFEFQDKVNEMEEEDAGMFEELSQKIKSLAIHYFSKGKEFIHNKTKESNMDQKEKEVYEKKIADLEKEKNEFAAAKKESDRIAAESVDKQLKEEIHSFCEANKLNTNKHKEMKIEEVMFAAAKANQTIEFTAKVDGKDVVEKRPLLTVLRETLKTFHVASPDEGEIAEFNQSLKADQTKGTDAKLAAAAEYVKTHPAEFSVKSTQLQKVARALEMEANKQIKFS